MENKPVAEQDIGRQLLQETAAYAESSVCRRKMCLHYCFIRNCDGLLYIYWLSYVLLRLRLLYTLRTTLTQEDRHFLPQRRIPAPFRGVGSTEQLPEMNVEQREEIRSEVEEELNLRIDEEGHLLDDAGMIRKTDAE